MHNIDRTQLEYNPQGESFEFGELGEQEWGETSGEVFGETFGETWGEAEAETWGEAEGETWAGESWSGEVNLSEAQEIALANELLEVSTEAELDQFLGKFIRGVGRFAGRVVRSPLGKAIGGVLKGVAKKALPLAGGALGAWVGGPLGAKIGSGLASAAGKALGLEAESLSQEDREFEGARQFVRFAANTAQRAVSSPAGADPRAVAQAAAVAAAKRFAPGLLGSRGAAALARGQSGRWVRRGRAIVLLGA